MREASPEKYAKALTVRVSEEEYRKLKELAERERRTMKALLLIAFDKAFPDWRKQ
jgi:predicted transcriptional regulator